MASERTNPAIHAWCGTHTKPLAHQGATRYECGCDAQPIEPWSPSASPDPHPRWVRAAVDYLNEWHWETPIGEVEAEKFAPHHAETNILAEMLQHAYRQGQEDRMGQPSPCPRCAGRGVDPEHVGPCGACTTRPLACVRCGGVMLADTEDWGPLCHDHHDAFVAEVRTANPRDAALVAELRQFHHYEAAKRLEELLADAKDDRLRAVLEEIGEMTTGGLADQAPWVARRAICHHERIVEHRSGARDETRGYYHCDYCHTPATDIAGWSSPSESNGPEEK